MNVISDHFALVLKYPISTCDCYIFFYMLQTPDVRRGRELTVENADKGGPAVDVDGTSLSNQVDVERGKARAYAIDQSCNGWVVLLAGS